MKKSSNYSCFIILLVILSTIYIAAFGLDEASTLLQFKQSSIKIDPNGFLNNWKNASNLCDWSGVFCSQGSIHALNLSNMGLVGPLNLDILMALPNLSEVNLHGNHLSSSSLSSSTSLSCSFKTVDISANNLSVPISGSFLTSCHNLLSLNLSRNSIPGGVLSFGSSSSSIEVLDLSINQISDSGLLNSLLSSCRTLSYLNMSANKLTGKLPRAISALCVNLTVLDLSYNEFSGEIPAAGFVAQVPVSLKQLDLSHNNFTGDFSKYNFGFCGGITHLDISSNGLNGSGLPPSLAKCRLLERLALSGNNFTGELPTFWASFGNLKNLYLSDNQFSGEIPFQLGLTCKTLVELDLSGNKLVGELPTSFIGCSSLQSLNLGNNQLSGDFVRGVISTITSLNFLYLPFNNITGSLPFQALTNCTSLQVIDLSSNNFTGEIPTGFGFCKSLPSLKKLLFANNFISGNISAELGDCTNLNAIDFSFNDLTGAIPNAVWSLPKLSNLVIWANRLTGEMPIDLCTNTSNFETLILGYNQISGIIPPSITRCTNVVWISLSGNKLSGEIPSDIGNLNKLAILQLGNNLLSGGIPPDMGNCKNLIWLDLTLNNLTGPIPPQLASQTGLIQPGNVTGTRFAFLRNEAGNICPGSGTLFEFEGIRPERLVNFPLVQPCPSTRIYTGTAFYSFASNGSIIYMDLSYNSLNGSIPVEFGPMAFLLVLNLGHNELTGSIPESFGGMKTLGVLDVSHNHLTGSIPGSLVTLSFLNDMDVSNNDLVGPIPSGGQLMTFPPDRYANNSALCGLPLPPCGAAGRNGSHPDSNSGGKKRFSGGSMVVGLTLAFLIIVSLFAALFKIRNSHNKGEAGGDASYIEPFPTSFSIGGTSTWRLPVEPLSINVATFEKPLRKLTFAHLVEATNDFSADTLIGSGGFGEVYKAKLGDGSVVAVKKLARVTGQGDREFTAEMETIGKIKHRNLVPLLGYCKVGEERILVYEYMKYGSLDILLQTKSKFLDWSARKKIAIGSARGLAFLHHSCIPHIIHRDMKSSNVLLDENLDARVSDFGMARLMNALDTHLSVSTLAGTPGYVPPEYYQSFRCTTKGDVYSYGVVLLELLSGKKPIDPIEFGDNNLVGWAKQLVRENRSNELFDSELLAGRKSGQAELYQYLKIACECLDDRPLRRPTMIQVMAMFKEIHFDSDSDFLDGFSVGKSVIDETKEKGPPDQCL